VVAQTLEVFLGWLVASCPNGSFVHDVLSGAEAPFGLG